MSKKAPAMIYCAACRCLHEKPRCADKAGHGWHRSKAPKMSSEYVRNRRIVVKNFNGACSMCGKLLLNPKHIEVDHIIPRSQGGGDELSNLRVVCHDCHKQKSHEEAEAGRLRRKYGRGPTYG